MTARKFFHSLAILFLLVALPTAYTHINDFRVLPALVLASFLCTVVGGFRIKIIEESCLYILLLLYCFLVSSFSFNYSVFGATIIFYWFAYWPIHMKEYVLTSFDEKKILAIFVLIGFFCALGIFLQVGLFNFAGIQFGKLDLDGDGRQAFGFLWTDYSFLSLFLASLVPLVWITSLSFVLRVGLSLSLILASVLTTARTGIVSLALTIAIFLVLEAVYSVIVGKVKKSLLLLFTFIIIISPSLVVWLVEKFPRIASFDDSGRIEGFIMALKFIQENALVGAGFNIQFYKDNIDVIPHNMFIYIATVGGITFLALFIFWGVAVTLRIMKLRERCILLSFFVSLIGFQLIPSFFSAYYFAFFMSICLMISMKKRISISNKYLTSIVRCDEY